MTKRTFADRGIPKPRNACPRCGEGREVILTVTAQRRREGGKGGRGATLATFTRTLCESCAVDSFEIAEEEIGRV